MLSLDFFLPIINNHTHDVEIYCYANIPSHDDISTHIQNSVSCWRNIYHVDDDKVVEIIARDGIDILVDLSGHVANHRLGVFARRPAPVQVTYLGYANTTGLSSMDYRLVDSYTFPEGLQKHGPEKIMRMPHCCLCYEPPDDSPEVNEPPVCHNGYITFGAFNNICKVNPVVVKTWSAILKALPSARMMCKCSAFNDATTREHYYGLFEKNDVDVQRVDLLWHVPTYEEHMRLYDHVDISLDTFPYNGAYNDIANLYGWGCL